MEPKNVVAFSGGKDSTVLAHRMAELGEDFVLLFTPTGNELPGVVEYVHATASKLNRQLVLPPVGLTSSNSSTNSRRSRTTDSVGAHG